jgi:hypothetical protein
LTLMQLKCRAWAMQQNKHGSKQRGFLGGLDH